MATMHPQSRAEVPRLPMLPVGNVSMPDKHMNSEPAVMQLWEDRFRVDKAILDHQAQVMEGMVSNHNSPHINSPPTVPIKERFPPQLSLPMANHL